MHGTEPGAGEHRDDRLGNHGHVDDHAVALLDTEVAQYSGEACDLVEQLGVGVRGLRIGDRTVVDEGELVAEAVLHVTVQRVETGVHLPVGEPAVDRRTRVVEDDRWLAVPADGLGRLTPKSPWIVDALPPGVSISFHTRKPPRAKYCLRESLVEIRRSEPSLTRVVSPMMTEVWHFAGDGALTGRPRGTLRPRTLVSSLGPSRRPRRRRRAVPGRAEGRGVQDPPKNWNIRIRFLPSPYNQRVIVTLCQLRR